MSPTKRPRKRKGWEPPEFVWSNRGPIPVEYTDDIRYDQGNRLAGVAMLYERKIAVDASLPQHEVEAVLAHEALHIWAHDSGFDDLFKNLEEPFVQSLSSFMVSYFRHLR